MGTQRFYANPRDSFAWPNGAKGYRPGGPFDCIGPFAKVANCPIAGTCLRLTCYATGYADTFFSVPAATNCAGRHVGGFFTVQDADGLTSSPDAGCVFVPSDKHAARVPTARKGSTLKLGAAYLQHKRFTLLTDSQDIAAACDAIGVNPADVSGVLAHVADGDYVEVWITRYRRSHELESVYDCAMCRATLADVRKFEQENRHA